MSEVNRVVIPAEPAGPVAPAQPEAAPERPSWLPEKFKSPEDMAKAYAELETKLGQPKSGEQETPKATEQEPKAEDQQKADDAELKIKEAADVLTVAGLNMGTFTAEWEKEGKLSDESYKALEEKGFPKAVVDTYIAGITATQTVNEVVQEKYANEVKALAGGDEGYKNLAAWASKNLSAEEIDAYDSIMETGDVKQIKLAVSGLKARMDASEGVEPSTRLSGGKANASDVFTSVKQVTEAMRDPRYKSDPVYRQQIEQKVMRSNIL